MKRKPTLIIVLSVAVLVLFLFAFDFLDISTKTSYKDFLSLIEEEKVESIVIEGGTLRVKAEGKTFPTLTTPPSNLI